MILNDSLIERKGFGCVFMAFLAYHYVINCLTDYYSIIPASLNYHWFSLQFYHNNNNNNVLLLPLFPTITSVNIDVLSAGQQDLHLKKTRSFAWFNDSDHQKGSNSTHGSDFGSCGEEMMAPMDPLVYVFLGYLAEKRFAYRWDSSWFRWRWTILGCNPCGIGGHRAWFWYHPASFYPNKCCTRTLWWDARKGFEVMAFLASQQIFWTFWPEFDEESWGYGDE